MAANVCGTLGPMKQRGSASFVLRRTWSYAGLMTVLITLAACRTTPMHETGFLNRTVTVGSTSYPYVVYVPRDFDPHKQWPVILFLHGSGERGNDGVRATQIGVASAVRSHPERVPAIVVFPQAPADSRWLGEPADAAMQALDHAIAEFHGDRTRIYLTGLSMGGYGVYHLALAHPGRFAALVVVCGGLLPHATTTAVQQSPLTMGTADPYAFTAHALRTFPIWIFHGDADAVIPVEESRHVVAELRREGSTVRYTEYPGTGHNAWDRAYGEAELWTWLFAKR
jgi:predicted peptidase